MLNPLRLVSLLSLVALAAGCSVNPVTGKNEFSIVSAEREVAIGEQNYQPSQQSQGGRYYIDPELQLYVQEVGRKLAAVSDRPNLPYEFVVLNNSVPNAWALPGGKIAINRGLLLHLEDESQLAAVLGHEIVHAAARHTASQMTRGTFIGLGAQILGIAGQSAGYGQLGSTAAQLGAAAWMARYGREDELESDNYGMEYMARAGYDPSGAVELQRTFVKLSEGRQQDFLSGLFASHPPSRTRVDANIAKARTLPKGNTFRDRYQQKIARLKRDKPAYDAEAEAIKALNNKDAKTALMHLDKAVKLQPREGCFWELRGHAWTMLGNTGNAEKAFTTAIGKNPDLFSHHLARGILRVKEGNRGGAKPDLERSYRLLPTPPASFYLGEMAEAAGDAAKAVEYYRQAAQGKGQLADQARQKLARLEIGSAPDRYIASRVTVASDGYLQVTIRNTSNIPVTGIRLEVTEMVSAFAAGQRYSLTGPQNLGGGQRVTIKTRLGPYETTDAARNFRAKVIAASPAQ